MPKIIIKSQDLNGSTPVHINGEGRKIPHNTAVEVSDDELAVLQDADLPFATINVLPDEVEAEADPQKDGIAEDLTAGTEGAADPATPARTTTEPNRLLTGEKPEGFQEGPPETAELKGGDETGHGAGQQSEHQTGADSDQHSSNSANGGGAGFDAEAFLDRNIDAISEDLDEVNAEQVDTLIRAEKAGKNRSTLLDKLDHKKTQFAAA